MKSKIENIVEKINETIVRQLKCKTGEEFPIQAFGIAFPIQIKDEESDSSFPAIVLKDGECHYVFSDDSYAAGLYHRIISKSYNKVKGFGRDDLDIEVNDIIMVIWGFSNQIDMNALEFEREIIIPSISKHVALVSSDFDSHRVSQSEFRNINYLNRPEEFIFSVKYKVQCTFDRKCALETHCD